jgi:hypothetical protein
MHNKKNNTNKNNKFIQGLRPFSNSLPYGLKSLLKKGGYNFSNIVDNWGKMVGKETSELCYPNTVKMGSNMSNGTLIVNVIHGNELTVEYGKQEIIEKINSFFGYSCIKEIKLRIVQEKKLTKNNIKTSDNLIKYNKKIKDINNQKLKISLDKLIEAFNDKNN